MNYFDELAGHFNYDSEEKSFLLNNKLVRFLCYNFLYYMFVFHLFATEVTCLKVVTKMIEKDIYVRYISYFPLSKITTF